MTEKTVEKTAKKVQRYSISVSSKTYDRIRKKIPGSLAGFVDDALASALEDPVTLARLVAKCRPRKDARS